MKTDGLNFDAQALREKILDLAMRGKLVKRDPNDEPASVLLEKIKAEKEQLIKEKKIKKSKPLPPIRDDEKPFDIPDSWEWVRLGDIGIWAAGSTPSRKHPEYYNGNIPWLKTGDLNDDVVIHTSESITKAGFDNSSVKINKSGNVLIAMYGATIGKLGIAGKEMVTNQACCGCTPYSEINNWFLFYYLLDSRKRLIDLGSGGAQPNISKTKIEHFYFALPPRSEQSRIAAKIEQLFALLRKVETSTKQYQQLQTLLKNKVLDLAMRGKLVKQNPNDETASVLLKKIKAEKEQLIKEKKIKKSKPLPPITDDKKPFDIPDSWSFIYINDIANVTKLAGFEYTKYIKPNLKTSGIPLFKAKNIQNGKINEVFENYISNSLSNSLKRSQLNKKCLLTPYVGSIGNVAIFSGKYKAHLGSNVGKIELIKNLDQGILEEFLQYYLQSPEGYRELTKHLKSTAQPSISITAIRQVIVPVPPFSEQSRIADSVDKIFARINNV